MANEKDINLALSTEDFKDLELYFEKCYPFIYGICSCGINDIITYAIDGFCNGFSDEAINNYLEGYIQYLSDQLSAIEDNGCNSFTQAQEDFIFSELYSVEFHQFLNRVFYRTRSLLEEYLKEQEFVVNDQTKVISDNVVLVNLTITIPKYVWQSIANRTAGNI